MSTKSDEQWLIESQEMLAINRCPTHMGFQLESFTQEKNEAVLCMPWKEEVGQLQSNPIFSGIGIVGLADLTACHAVIPYFGNTNVVTAKIKSFSFKRAAPAEHTLYARSTEVLFTTNPRKPGDSRITGADVTVLVFVKDFNGAAEYVVAEGSFGIIWLG